MSARIATLVILVAACACSRAPQRDLFAEGETLFLNGKYTEAAEVFRQRLLDNPNDAGAHYYLGTTYLYRFATNQSNAPAAPIFGTNQNWLGIAQGELETAVSLFKRQGKTNPVPRFDTNTTPEFSPAQYFEMICHVNQAKILLLLTQSILENPRTIRGLNPLTLLPGIIEKCQQQADEAERAAPGHPDVAGLKLQIEELVKVAGPMLRAPSVPQRAPNAPRTQKDEVPALSA